MLTEIRSLLDKPAAGAPSARARVEQTLTDGYAHALALDGDRLRVERRLRELIRKTERNRLAEAEVASLTRALAETDRELAGLRGLLAELRAHAL